MQPLKFIPPIEQKTYEVPDDELPQSAINLLVLEDDPDLGETLKLFLEENGYKVTRVKDGVEGLKQVMAADFDAILCDLMMPNLPGDMFYRAVERTKPHLCKRFIFITGHQGNEKLALFIKSVRALTLYKPFSMQLLLENIQLIISKSRKGS
ncbi:MAG: response regulator [Verrucomicrobiota bacterium]|nr:response regulator [Verrucomicrobiota bacterium]